MINYKGSCHCGQASFSIVVEALLAGLALFASLAAPAAAETSRVCAAFNAT